jgi:hypothetical protein
MAEGFGSDFSSGTALTPYYSTDSGNTWCELYYDNLFATRDLGGNVKQVRFKTAGEQAIENISGTSGQPLVVTSMNHGYSDGQLIYVSGNSQVNSETLCMISDRTSDTFKLKNATTGAYLLSNGSTVAGGTFKLAPFNNIVLRIMAKTPTLPNSEVRPKTPIIKKATLLTNLSV